MTNVAPGDILIFHINGRGFHTAEALPQIIDRLQADGYRFVLVSEYIGQPRRRTPGMEARVLVWRSRIEDWLTRISLLALHGIIK